MDLPWLNYAVEKKDIGEAKKILDEDHWGLEKVKDRIIEHLSVQILTNKLPGPHTLLGGTSRCG